MKKLMISMLAIASMTAMVSCSNENDPIDDAQDQPVEIKMSAGILNVSTKAPIDETLSADLNDIAFIRFDGAQNGTWTWDETLNPINAIIKKADMGITFTPVQYYPTDKSQYAHLIGYYPSTIFSSRTNKNITITGFDGTQDIMYAGEQKGNKENASITTSFAHQLSQLKFKFEKESSFTNTSTISNIVIKGTKEPISLDLSNGAITYGTNDFSINLTGKSYVLDGTEQAQTLIQAIPTEGTATDITLDITLSDGTTFPNVTVTGIEKPEKGKAHLITLTFSQKDVAAIATIAKWEDSTTTGSGNVQ